jgi:hypothetical protein
MSKTKQGSKTDSYKGTHKTRTLPQMCSVYSEMQAANLTVTHWKTLWLCVTPNTVWYRAVCAVLNDSTNDQQWQKSGEERIWLPTLTAILWRLWCKIEVFNWCRCSLWCRRWCSQFGRWCFWSSQMALFLTIHKILQTPHHYISCVDVFNRINSTEF